MTEDKVLAGIASLVVILLVGAVFGRLHGAGGDTHTAIGDRVMCGLLALPLIALAIRVAFPASPFFWALLGPAPILIYTVLLATTERNGMSRFTRTLLIGIGAVYVVMAGLGVLQK
jgi:ABC-type dipeptide/oligopeptide/nickel transport system permease subunit